MYETRCLFLHFFPHCPILCLLPLHDRTEKVFRILQNILKKNSPVDPWFDVRFKRGPERVWREFSEGRMQVSEFQWDYNSRGGS